MDNSRITDVQIHFIKPQNGLLGFASMVVGGLYLSSIGIHAKLNQNGYRLTYPNRKVGDANLDVFHPVNRETGLAIEQAVLSKLKEVMSKCNDGYNRAEIRTATV